jgi:hypothetical protein
MTRTLQVPVTTSRQVTEREADGKPITRAITETQELAVRLVLREVEVLDKQDVLLEEPESRPAPAPAGPPPDRFRAH